MRNKNWKNVRPRDLRDALESCLEFARGVNNRSVDNVSDLMGLPSKWTLYKWVQEANLPTRMIKPFEQACGIDLVSRWLVISGGGRLVVDIPCGRKCRAEDINELQLVVLQAMQGLMLFYREQGDAEPVLEALQNALEALAWHRGNVEKYQQPELPFEGAD